MKCNGDALKIGAKAKEKGVKTSTVARYPKDFWGKVQAFFGKKFEKYVIEHKQIGVEGLQELLPRIYGLLYGFAEISSRELSEQAVRTKIESKADKLKPLIEQNKLEKLACEIGGILQELLDFS